MRSHLFALTCAVALLGVALPLVWFATASQARTSIIAAPQENGDGPEGYKVSGPYTHKNLTVFLLHGKEKVAPGTKTFMTLSEALTTKKVVVYETKSVNELAIENVSDEEVFVQSGDIVKGGQQDRMIGVDLIVPARSGKIKIAAFCVEQGRWTKRGSEDSTKFTSSTDRAATRELKLAANKSRSQGEVWAKVAKAQSKLGANVGGSVAAPASASSLQLSLENEKVRATTEEYVKALASIIEKRPDAVGYAFSINGKLNSADVYASPALFRKLWPGLLKSSAVEAVAELDGKPHDATRAEEVRAFITESESGAATEREVTTRVRMTTRETKTNILFETRDHHPRRKGGWVHKSYVKK
ncbi:MAG: hypothetical protein H7Z38_24155 [Rubrivivax sp.]|nr:hypothetical protein [Pyrinomonadaceae bacterium]